MFCFVFFNLTQKIITTYGGVTEEGETRGTMSFSANNFEPYIRTMPHAEYPSGSSCICSGWSNAMQEIFGTDDLTDLLPNGVSTTFSAFSSIKEPLSTPSSDITVYYKSFSEISKRCGETRLEGGMHFTNSVPDGESLCSDIGTKVGQIINMLYNGTSPQYMVDVTDLTLNDRDCYPRRKGKSKSHDQSLSESSSASARSSSGGKNSRSGRKK